MGGKTCTWRSKGTTTVGESVLVTRNEVEHARCMFPAIALVVVSGIVLHSDEEGVPIAEGGALTVIEPGDISRCELRPLAFECVIVGAPEEPIRERCDPSIILFALTRAGLTRRFSANVVRAR